MQEGDEPIDPYSDDPGSDDPDFGDAASNNTGSGERDSEHADPDDQARRRVAITLCTHRRPRVLQGLIDRLVEVADDAAEVASIAVVVVDDDPDGSAELVALAARSRFERGLTYRRTGARSISVARNASIDAGSEQGDWLAMIDDDCRPSVNWVRELLSVQECTGADSVVGACVDVAPPGAPSWLTDEPFLEEPADIDDRAETDEGHLKNLLLSVEFLVASGVRFDESLGVSGGEDAAFLHDLARAGASRSFAARAVVSEQVPSERATLRYQLRRRYWYGNTEAVTSITTGSASRLRMGARGVKLMVLTGVGLTTRMIRHQPTRWRFALSESARGVGRILGAFGHKVAHR